MKDRKIRLSARLLAGMMTTACFVVLSACVAGNSLIPPPSPVFAVTKPDAKIHDCKFLGVASGTFPRFFQRGSDKEKENYAVYNAKVAAQSEYSADTIHVVSINRDFDVRGESFFLIVAKAYRCAQP